MSLRNVGSFMFHNRTHHIKLSYLYTHCSKSTKSVNSLPIISYECADNETPAKINEIEYDLFCKHKNHESGMMKLQSKRIANNNESMLIATHSSTLIKLSEYEAKGSIHSLWPESFSKLAGNSLIILNGMEHRKIRKILNPLFIKDEALQNRFDIIYKCTQQLFDQLLDQQNIRNDGYIHIWPLAKLCSFDLILSVVFGDDIITKNERDKLLNYLFIWTEGFMDLNINNLNNPCTALGNAMFHRELIKKELEKLVFECIKRYNLDELDTKCTMHRLLDTIIITKNGKEITKNSSDDMTIMDIDDVTDHLLILINAGHDTTAASCCNILYCLYEFRENEFVKQLQSDIRSLCDNNKLFDYDTIMNNKYLDCFVKEVLRYIPTSVFLSKQFMNDCIINDYMVEKGNVIIVNLNMISKNDNIFENALQFHPLRFMHEPNKKIWYPFGLGSKTCLGWKLAYLELKIFTVMLCTQFEFQLDPERMDTARHFFNFFDVYGKFQTLSR